MDRGAWQATVHRVAKSWTWLSSTAVTTVLFFYYCYRSIYKTLLITKQQFYQAEKSPTCTLLILKQCAIKCTRNHENKRELQIEYWFIPDRSTEAFSQPTDIWEVVNNCCFNSLNSEIIYNGTTTKWYILWKFKFITDCWLVWKLWFIKIKKFNKTFHQYSMLTWLRRIKKLKLNHSVSIKPQFVCEKHQCAFNIMEAWGDMPTYNSKFVSYVSCIHSP